ncbi:ChbG/HpnK family deacetylase [Cohnella pontilimi]|uniref:ChbG/HpnK family deacetylase n=1 Tax=Cohnella pontilimi TaxID=2564100 RepID=A0A4U0FAI3_9BACL|nr:polysaccharide deacetylase family protein [Cohnella pontilimi]TJY41803.1 ChbG/HpnK family deacetylase [Cohnella pontilimi]
MSKYLILNCDDFGQSRAANTAIQHLLSEKKVSSATIMPPAPGFQEAAAWVRETGNRNIGLHLTFTSEFAGFRWPSLTGHPSLHDESGNMHMTVEAFERNADPAAVKAEMLAQFEAVKQAGIPISHVDNHMGSLYGIATGRSYLPTVLWLCAKRRLPFRIFRNIYEKDEFLASIPNAKEILAKVVTLADALGVAMPDYLLSHPYHIEEGETYDRFKASLIRKLYELPEGVCETYIHPGIDDEEMRRLIPSWEKRVWEYRLVQDPDFTYALRDAGVTLTDYYYVKSHLKRPRVGSIMALLKLLVKQLQ